MADSKLRVRFLGDTSSLNDALQNASRKLDSFGKKASQIGKDLSLRLTLPIATAAGASIKMASDMEESTNKVRVAFGDSSKSVEQFAKTSLRSFGIAESSALDMTALFGDMATGMGVSQSEAANLSKRLVGLAGDLASFKNINISEVTTALSGVFTGETESLKRLGIVMTEANLEQFRMNEGIARSVKEMSQQEKIMLRLRYIFSVTQNAQGDFARTSEGAANQMRIFQESLKEVGAELGKVMLPVFTKAATKVNELLDRFKNLDSQTQENIVKFTLLVGAIPPLIYAIGKLSEAFSMLNGRLGLILAAATAITFSFDAMGTVLDQTASSSDRLKNALKTLLAPIGAAMRFGYNVFIANTQGAVNQTEKLAADAEQAKAKLEKSFVLEFPSSELPFGRNDKVKMPIPIDDSQAIENSLISANEQAKLLDELLSSDAGLRFDLAAESASIQSFASVVQNTAEQITNPLDDMADKAKNVANQISLNFATVAQSIGQSLFAAFANGSDAMAALSQTILMALGDILIQMGSAAIAASELAKTFAIPVVGAAAGLAAIALGTLLKGMSSKIQGDGFAKFANGGIVSAPTLGLVGEYAGARSNPEVIAPLDKLKSLIGDRPASNVNVSGQFRLDGQDLVLALERANKQRDNFV